MTEPLQFDEPAVLVAEAPVTTTETDSQDIYVFPLSSMQERLWLEDSRQPGNPIYNTSFRWNLEGPLNPATLEAAFNAIIARHEILRTSFKDDGGPIQLVLPSRRIRIPVTDLRSLPEVERQIEMDRLSAAEARASFDLREGPLIRVGLLRMKEDHYVLLLTLHHIVSDGWSIGIFMEEMQSIYANLVAGRAPTLPPLPIQFGDYVEWQKAFLACPEAQRQRDYWKTRLEGYAPPPLPADYARPTEDTTAAVIISEMLPRELTDRLRSFASDDGGTMFSTTLAACLLLMHHFTHRDDVSVTTPVAGRNRTEFESLIGVFLNRVILRSQIAGDPAFHDFAAQVRNTVWEAFANQDLPSEAVQKALWPQSSDGGFPRVSFVCQREYARASTFVFNFDGVRVTTLPSKSQGALYDLSFFIVEREAGWRLSLEYKSDLYRGETAQALLGHFKAILETIAGNPQLPLSHFPALELQHAQTEPASNVRSADEADAGGADAAPGEETAAPADLFAMPASRAQERFWMLAELFPDNKAFNMAACVRLSGQLSFPALEKSLQAVVDRHESLRTTFKKEGGELLQIVHAHGAAKLEQIALDALPESERASRLEELVRREAEEPFDLSVGPLLRARLFRCAENDHVLVLTLHHILADGWSANILQRDLWTAYEALTTGAKTDLPALSIQYGDFAAWQRQWLDSPEAKEHFDFWQKVLAQPLPIADFPTDREPRNRPASRGAIETMLLPQELALAAREFAKSRGGTMFALTLASFALAISRCSGQQDVLIGSPVANRRPETEDLIGPFSNPFALRLNLSGNPILQDFFGHALDTSMGALNHTELPFESILERIRVKFVRGRNPIFQFYFFYQKAFLQPRQMGGLRVTPLPTFSVGTPFEIQLGMIEREEGIRAQAEYNPDLFDAATIQGFLAYYVEILRTLISTPTAHASQLPPPPIGHKVQTVRDTPAHIAPRTELESQLARIWGTVLDQPDIGVEDDFFNLGGSSLLAAKMMAQVYETFGVGVSLNSLLQYSTIAKLATLIKQPAGENPAHRMVAIKDAGSRPPVYWIPGGRAVSVLGLREVSLDLRTDQPIYGLESRLPQGNERFLSVEERAQKYLELVRTRQPKGPYTLIGYCTGGMVAYEMAQQLRAQGDEVAFLGLVQSGTPGFYARRLIRLQTSFARKRYVFLTIGGFLWSRLAARLPELRPKNPQAIRDRLARFLAGWISTSADLPEATQTANEEVMKRYRPRPYAGDVALFLAEDCYESAGLPPSLDSRLGWLRLIGGTRRVHRVPGDHHSILAGENARALASQLEKYLLPDPGTMSDACPDQKSTIRDYQNE